MYTGFVLLGAAGSGPSLVSAPALCVYRVRWGSKCQPLPFLGQEAVT